MWTHGSIAFGAAAAWFCAFACVHVAGMRLGAHGPRWLLTAYVLSVGGTAATILALTVGWSEPLAVATGVAVGVLSSACLFVFYVPALYTVLTSLSIQTMIALRRNGGALPESELFRRFASQPIFEARVRTLQASGYLLVEQDRYRLAAPGRVIARAFAAIKEFWRLGAGG